MNPTLKIEEVVSVQESKIPNPVELFCLSDSLNSLLWKLPVLLSLSWCPWTWYCDLPKLVDSARCILLSDPNSLVILSTVWGISVIFSFLDSAAIRILVPTDEFPDFHGSTSLY